MSGKHADLCPRVENYLPIYTLVKRFVSPHRVSQGDDSIDDTTLPDDTQYIPSAQKKLRGSDKDGAHTATPKLKSHISVVKLTTCEWYLVCLVDTTGR
jgi:hypothetical protein